MTSMVTVVFVLTGALGSLNFGSVLGVLLINGKAELLLKNAVPSQVSNPYCRSCMQA